MPETLAWAVIDLDAFQHNLRLLRSQAGPGCRLCAVVKANAYGHGAPELARAALQAGASHLAVATPDEALSLRDAGIGAPLLLLGAFPDAALADLLAKDIALTVYDSAQAAAISRAALVSGRPACVHLQFDTGMARLGFDVSTPESEIQGVLDLPGLRIEGIYTHFTSADGPDPAVTHDQIARFTARVLPLASRIHPRPLIHAANSAATLFFPAAQFDMVRTGIAMYGYPPRLPHDLPAGGSARGFELRQDEAVIQAFRPVMSFKTRLVQVREIEAGSPVSYGGTWIAPRWSRIGTLAVGYADGWSRSLSGRTRVRIGSSLVPQVGRVCMDMCMVDLTDFPAIRAGDEVTLFGPEGPTADDIATLTGSIPYEVLCMVSRRVPRIFAGGGLP